MSIPLVILHGWGATTRSYDRLKPLLEQKGFSVFVFDLPGFGKEAPPPKAWSVDDYADWTLKHLDAMGLQKYYLFGHSFGGRIVIKIAARQPKGLIGLILCDAAGVTPRPKIKIALFGFLSKIGNVIFFLPLLNFLRPPARKFVYWLSGERDYHYLQGDVMRETFRIVVAEDLTSFLFKISVPTMIIWGEKDKMTPLSDAHTINQGVSGSKLEILKNVGHNPHQESPEKLADIIEGFVKTLL